MRDAQHEYLVATLRILSIARGGLECNVKNKVLMSSYYYF